MSNVEKVQINELSDAIARILVDYGKECDEEVDKAAKSAMKELVRDTKRDAQVNPKGKKQHYKDQIASRPWKEARMKIGYQWYIKGDKYRIAHLLNNGHAKRNGGRVEGDQHVSKNATRILAKYFEKVKEAIANAGS